MRKLYQRWLMLPEAAKEIVVTCVTTLLLLGSLYAYVLFVVAL